MPATTRSPLRCVFGFALVGTLASASAWSAANRPAVRAVDDHGFDVRAVVDDAFRRLVDDRPAAHRVARRELARAAAVFDDLALDGHALERAFVGDATRPWRGRPFERVLALATLAALDIERGRCDLALPTLRTAALHDARAAPTEHDRAAVSDAVLVAALALRCLADGDASLARGTPAEVDDARRALRHALHHALHHAPHHALRHAGRGALPAAGDDIDLDVVERGIRHPEARLVLTGFGPEFRRSGPHGEQLQLVARDEDDGVAGVIRLGPRARRNADDIDDQLLKRRGHVLWSSWQQATSEDVRPFDAVRADRARSRDEATRRGQAALATAATATTGHADTALLARGLSATSGVGLLASAALLDARADDRMIPALPGHVWLVVPPT